MNRVGIIGAGGWGTALASLLAEKSEDVCIWSYDHETAEEINTKHTNEVFLAGAVLPDNIRATNNLKETLDRDVIVFVTPSSFARETARKMAEAGVAKDALVISCTKGIEYETGKLMSQILEEYLPDHTISVLSGPNHAEEVFRKIPAAGVIGSPRHETAEKLQRFFSGTAYRAYTSDDVAGIQLGGGLKNIFAVAAGISDGLGMGDNTKATLVTRSLAEMMRLGTTMGGRRDTFYGLSGVGDLMVTCFSRHSRNRSVGERLGRGESLASISASTKMIAEGVPTAKAAFRIARERNIETPLTDAVYSILYQNCRPADVLANLLERPPKPEPEGK